MSKSLLAKALEAVLRATKLKYMDSKEEVDKFIENPPETKVPKRPFKSKDLDGCEVFTFGDENAENTILYVHGGAYVLEINFFQLLHCRKLAKKLNAYVVAPVYPLAPSNQAHQTYDLLTPLYEKLSSRNNLILMGDSAGGGFVYSFCQYIKDKDLPQPYRIITYSPWVDISMSNIPYNSEEDATLGDVGLREIGKTWAGDWNTQDYRVSPIFGDNTGLPDTLIFVGGEELFYDDIHKYAKKLRDNGVDAKISVGEGMFHIYPVFPISESNKVVKEIQEYLNK
ncbi:alpha/beta hydrolase fold domain-containing protein [Methanosphaera sp. BMS]|uniref:alpha/beta hydrolase fold domain-containing protein n=1 Tax=Methanosphaera sp. BMS TaxID=1789762 RepID=UPI000DC1F623|nr:alpha/beta hydrolase [Methanosphaera sp. BMS]AWX32045.1 hypothetical protein AW729_02565 [Methanosphaera sp. BMS]